jgi:hypothetical protein
MPYVRTGARRLRRTEGLNCDSALIFTLDIRLSILS